jgi:hypothetical protein
VRINRYWLSGSRLARAAFALALPRPLQQGFIALVALASAAALAPATAAGQMKVDEGGGDVLDLHPARGMAATNPLVREILAAHPDQFVVICVAGCNGKTRIVQVLPEPITGRAAENVPSAASMNNGVYGPPRPGKAQHSTDLDEADDVVCLAGCIGRPGKVLQRITDLPSPARLAPKAHRHKQSQPLDVLP